jgi:hypothetical protein
MNKIIFFFLAFIFSESLLWQGRIYKSLSEWQAPIQTGRLSEMV